MIRAAFLFISLLLAGCAQKEVLSSVRNKTAIVPSSHPLKEKNYDEVLALFVNECRLKKVCTLYGPLCSEASQTKDPKAFITKNFKLYKIEGKKGDRGLLTGYYEASLYGSRTKHFPFLYPLYSEPDDLVSVELSSIYPQLKGLRLRGRLDGKKLVPYYTRADLDKIKARPICYVDDKVARFFLEVQGSGRVMLDTGETIYVAYANQNGHRYTSIGRYMIQKGYIARKDLSMQSIERFFKVHPEKVDEVLKQNRSLVFFRVSDKPATGALGVELTPMRSVAVDPRYIPLGAMLYIEAPSKRVDGIVFAQDTGGAIKGAVRADLFTGYGEDAMKLAGGLKEDLHMWILLPKDENE